MERKGSISTKRTIAVILLAASLVMAFLPWISIRMDLGDGVHTLKEAYAHAARENGTSAKEVRSEFMSSMENMIDRTVETMREEGVRTSLTGKQYLGIYKAAEDGKISPNELARMAAVMSKLYKATGEYYTKLYGSHGTQMKTVRMARSNLTAAVVLLWIGMILTVGTFLLACWAIGKGKKLGAVPYAVTWLFLFIYTLIVVGKLNTPELAQMWPNTFNGSVSGTVSFRIMAWPIIGTVLALAACVTVYLPMGGETAAVRPAVPVKVGGWRCPGCGAMCGDDAVFCGNCGARKPEPRRCPGCGAVVDESGAFCTNCGTPLAAPVSVTGNGETL